MVERVRELIEDMYKKALHDEAELIPGASEILKKIPTLGLKMALVTSTPFRYLQIKLNPLRKAGVADLFDVVITSDDVTRKKPAPDPLITCGQRLGVPMERAVYVGDSRVDIRAGKAAGMKTAGVLTGMEDRESLVREHPDIIMENVADLLSLIVKNS
jgi:HAD superfamily hydrolase (TIGR01509 family)